MRRWRVLFSLPAVPKKFVPLLLNALIMGHSTLFPGPSKGLDVIINALCASGGFH